MAAPFDNRRTDMNRNVYGIDVGKQWFHVVAVNGTGTPMSRHKLNRSQIVAYFAKLPPGIVAMETCPGTHHLGRSLEQFGHEVRLLACQFVSPYRKSQKNDFNDAEAIAEAASRPTMRFQRVRPPEQLDLQAIHRVRERLISERTGVINQVRAFLLENGVAVATGKVKLARELPRILARAEGCVSPRMNRLILQLAQRWRQIDAMIEELTGDLTAAAKSDPLTKRLLTVPGIGPIVASALVATVGNAANFRRARDLAAWIGLVPGQYTTGGKPRLLGLRYTGQVYLRCLLIHGARSVVRVRAHYHDRLGGWVDQLVRRVHINVAICAVANKIVRIAWALLRKGSVYGLPAPAVN
jgi:transposase